jgi:hypothetical protein
MSTISISNLKPSGLELFSDSESYLNEISENELTDITGGSSPICLSIGARVSAASSYRCFQSLVRFNNFTAKDGTRKIGEFFGKLF